MIPNLLSSIFALPASNLSMLMLLAKATIILIAALGITLAMQRASAGARHLVWLVTLGTLLLVPAIAAWAPMRLAILPPAPAAQVRDANPAPVQAPTVLPSNGASPASITTSPSVGVGDDNVTRQSNAGVLSRVKGLSGIEAVLAIWAVIVVALGAWLAYGALAVRGIVRRARPLDSQDWLAPLYEVSDRLSLDEAPRLLRSEDAKMPFACGVIHPTIVLPAECDNWTPDRRLAVLLHELAHVRRHDLIGHTLGRLACAFYWFHPLVWTAAKHLRSESERACDDLALACGARPSDYAEHLLDIVTSVRHDSTPVVALAMARRKEFEGRMLAILDPELRHSSPSRWQSASLIGSLALIAILVGAAAPAQRQEIKTPPVTESNSSAPATVELALAPKSDQIITTKGDHALDAKTKPEPKYPNSGVRGIASTAERMIQQITQSTQVHTQTSMQVRTQTVVSPGSEKVVDGAADKAEKIAEMLSTGGARVTVQGKADDRPLLLANVLKTDTSASLRRIAAWGLAEYAETQIATDALAYALLHDSNAGVREMAAWALGNGDGDSSAAVDALTSALRRDSNSRVRTTAIWALGDIGDKGSIDVVIAALSDTSSGIRFRAIWALGQIGPRQAPKALIEMLRDPDPRVREITAWALYEIEDPGAVPALDAALRAESDKNLQVAYIRALAATGEKSVDAVRRLLQSNDPQIRSMAVRALAGGNAAGPWPWPWPEPRPQP